MENQKGYLNGWHYDFEKEQNIYFLLKLLKEKKKDEQSSCILKFKLTFTHELKAEIFFFQTPVLMLYIYIYIIYLKSVHIEL